MEPQHRTWTPKTMAAALGIHPNTIRMYEDIGLITKPERKPNGYRVLTDVHLLQLRMCRIIFGCPYANRAIRGAGTLLLEASARLDLPRCRMASTAYLEAIRREIGQAEETRRVLTEWLADESARVRQDGTISRLGAARLVGVTVETIRNWERNGLLPAAGIGSRSERLYPAASLGRMRIIYMLRRTGYSMQAILRCLNVLDESKHPLGAEHARAQTAAGGMRSTDRMRLPGKADASGAVASVAGGEDLRLRMLHALEMPEAPEEPMSFVIMGDHWLDSLREMEADALRLFPLVDSLEALVS